MDAFSENITTLRLERKLSKKDVAQAVGVSANTYGAYEAGEKVPTLTTARRIAETLGVSLDWLCGIESLDRMGVKPSTWGDVLRLLDMLVGAERNSQFDSKVHYYQCYGADEEEITEDVYMSAAMDYPENQTMYKANDFTLIFPACPIGGIVEAWQKLLSLYRSGMIDEEMYQAWVEKKIAEMSKMPLSLQ